MPVNNSIRVDKLLKANKYYVKDGLIFNKKGKLIRGSRMKNGYMKTVLTDNKEEFNATLHQIIWVDKHGSYNSSMEINHLNGDKQNNIFSNLELITKSENIKHAFRTGLGKHGGTTWWQSKLGPAGLKLLFKLRSDGWTQRELSKRFGLDQSNISRILRGLRYKEEVLTCL